MRAFAPELLNDVDCFIVIPYPVPEKIKLKPFQRSFACSKVIMENRGQPYSESLKKTLNCYQLSSLDSLSGPSGLSALTAKLWFKDNKQAPPIPPPPLIQIPLLMPNDTSTQRSETLIAGHAIACFVVGGEKRLCLPQIINIVLRDFDLTEINRACSELHIYCSRCSPDQLEILKVIGVLPFNTTECGLITKTDAERLVSTLGVEFHLNTRYSIKEDVKGVPVYHECFGRGDGIFYSDLYTSPDAPCIACADCKICLSPSRFVGHSHRGLEKHTCHWGFDPENWRNYLLLPKDTEKNKVKDLEETMDSLKSRFSYGGVSPNKTPPISPGIKRRQESEQELPQAKKFKEEKLDDLAYLSSLGVPPFCYGLPLGIRPSAFRPWTAGIAASLAHLPEFRTVHDDALLKALAPIANDRRLFPGYLQFGSSSLLPNIEPSILGNLSTATAKEKVASSPKVADSEYSRRSSDSGCQSKKSCQDSSERCHGMSSVSPTRSTEGPARELDNKKASATPSRWRSSDTSPRNSPNRPSSHAGSPRKHIKTDADRARLHAAKQEPTANARDENGSRQKSPALSDDALSVDKTVSPLLAMSKAVAAASAMLELSTSAAENRRALRDEKVATPGVADLSRRSSHRQDAPKSPDQIKPEPPLLQVIPLSETHEHYKWSLGPSSHIISASGTHELQQFNSMLEAASVQGKAKQQMLYDLVKMKSRYEERLDIQERVKKDLEAECERVKASKKQQLKEAADVRQEMQQEMERMRAEHCRKIEDLHDKLACLERQLEKASSPSSSPSADVTDAQQMMNNMRKQIQEKDVVLSQLRADLIGERDKRLAAEMKLDEMLDRSSGRMSFLMDEALSSMMRAGKKSNDELFSRSRQTLFPSASSRKSFETLVSTVYGRSAPRSLEEDAGRRRDNGRSEHYDVADIKIISNGFAKRHQLCRDDDDRAARDTSPGK